MTVVRVVVGVLVVGTFRDVVATLFGADMRRSKLLTLDDLTEQLTPLGYLRRDAHRGDLPPLYREFREWDDWCADVYDSHTAYPMLIWFRSRQVGRSWAVGLAIVLEAASDVLAAVNDQQHQEAQSLYRRAVMMLDTVRNHEHVQLPQPPPVDPAIVRAQFREVYDTLVDLDLPVRPFEESLQREHALRADYLPVLYLTTALLLPIEFRPNVRAIPVSFEPSAAAGSGADA